MTEPQTQNKEPKYVQFLGDDQVMHTRLVPEGESADEIRSRPTNFMLAKRGLLPPLKKGNSVAREVKPDAAPVAPPVAGRAGELLACRHPGCGKRMKSGLSMHERFCEYNPESKKGKANGQEKAQEEAGQKTGDEG